MPSYLLTNNHAQLKIKTDTLQWVIGYHKIKSVVDLSHNSPNSLSLVKPDCLVLLKLQSSHHDIDVIIAES